MPDDNTIPQEELRRIEEAYRAELDKAESAYHAHRQSAQEAMREQEDRDRDEWLRTQYNQRKAVSNE